MSRLTSMLAGASAFIAMTAASSAQDVTLKLHQMLPPQATIPAKALTPWAEKVMAESGGRIKIELHTSMQLGGSPGELYDQVRTGAVELAWTPIGLTPGRFPAAEAFELPFLAANGEATSRALQEYCARRCAGEFQEVKVVAWHASGPGLIHSRNPITRLEDMNGLRIRGGSRVVDQMLEKLGAAPFDMPLPALPEALSRGLIDAAAIPWDAAPPLKVAELVKNHTGFSGRNGLYAQTFAFVMNKDAYDSLPDDLKHVIDANSGIETAAMMGRTMDEGDKLGLETARKLGNPIVTLDEVETQRWKDAAAPLIAAWEAEMAARGMDGRGLVAEARALVEKHAAGL